MIIRSGSRFGNAQVIGADVEYLAINNDNLIGGRPLRRDDVAHTRQVALIGPTVAEDLFSRQDPIGRELRIDNRRYVVIGLLQPKSRDLLSSIGSAGGQDANNRIAIPFTTLQAQLGTRDVDVIQAEATDLQDAGVAVAQLTEILQKKYGNRYSYKSSTMAQYIDTANRILRGVSLIGVVAASVSLLVGGLGIMNIISTSVLERTREIGLRKAIGANRRDILHQFLAESVIIGAAGGLLGLMFDVLASMLLTRITGFPLAPSWHVVMAAFLVSIFVGLLSGYYPSRRAAQMRPVIALRYE